MKETRTERHDDGGKDEGDDEITKKKETEHERKRKKMESAKRRLKELAPYNNPGGESPDGDRAFVSASVTMDDFPARKGLNNGDDEEEEKEKLKKRQKLEAAKRQLKKLAPHNEPGNDFSDEDVPFLSAQYDLKTVANTGRKRRSSVISNGRSDAQNFPSR